MTILSDLALLHLGKERDMVRISILELIANLLVCYMVYVSDIIASHGYGLFSPVLMSRSNFYIHMGRWIRWASSPAEL